MKDYHLLLLSMDGQQFLTLASPANAARSFIYESLSSDATHYGASVDNGTSHRYHPTLSHRKENELRPVLTGNPVCNSMIMIKSPGKYSWAVCDLDGQEIRKGELATGTNMIYIPGMKRGIYMIRFTGSNKEWTEKLIHQ